MRGGSDLIQAIHNLKLAYEHLDSFRREHKGSKGDFIFSTYQKKIEWIVKDFVTIPYLPQEVRDGVKKEWNSDIFTIPAILEKISLLDPTQRDAVEKVIDTILDGEKLEIQINP